MTDDPSLGPSRLRVLATLNLTLATASEAIVSTVGSIRRSVISVPQASAKTWQEKKKKHLSAKTQAPSGMRRFMFSR